MRTSWVTVLEAIMRTRRGEKKDVLEGLLMVEMEDRKVLL